MQNYSAIVTGGAQGIGKAIAQALVAAGYFVVIVDSDARAAAETCEELGAERMRCVAGSAAEPKVIRQAVKLAGKLGNGLAAAVANAGVSRFKPLAKLSLREWNDVLAINLTGGFLLAKYAAPSLARKQGAMVLVASSRALQSEAGTLAYSASKAASWRLRIRWRSASGRRCA